MQTKIIDNRITFTDYPFPSMALKAKNYISADEILSIDLNSIPMQIQLKDEIIFLEDVTTELPTFIKNNNVKVAVTNDLWNLIALPVCLGYDDQIFNYYERLQAKGVEKVKVDTVRFILSLVYEEETNIGNFERHGLYGTLLQVRNSPFWKDRIDAFYDMVMTIACYTKKKKLTAV